MITSRQNPRIQKVKDQISHKKARLQTQSFVAEGVRLVEEAYAAHWRPEILLYSKELSARGMQLIFNDTNTDIEIIEVSSIVMKHLSDTETSQGLLAVFRMKVLPIPEDLDFVLIADGIKDPGNLGTILRSASAAGAQAVLLTPGTTDAFSSKVLRAAMGAHFQLPIHTLNWRQIQNVTKHDTTHNLKFFLTKPLGDISIWEANFNQPLAIIIGSEAEGTSDSINRDVDTTISIPMPGGCESLNAAVAAGIILFEVVHQRRL